MTAFSYWANSAADGKITSVCVCVCVCVCVLSLCCSGGEGLLDQHPKAEAQGPCLWRPSQKRLAGGRSLTSTKYALLQTATCSGAVCFEPASDRVSKVGVVSPYAATLLDSCCASLSLPNAIQPITRCHLVWVRLVGSLTFSRVPLSDDSQNLT